MVDIVPNYSGYGDPYGRFNYKDIEPITDFRDVTDETVFRAVPDDWFIILTDIVDSTSAIAAGQYKAVNFAGAAVIAAVFNALGNHDVPFVFAGDGASLLVGPREAKVACAAAAAAAAWTKAELNLDMRVAVVPVAAVREAGLDLQVARYAPSPDVSFAMVTGGGLSFAERALKQGRYAVQPARGARPDLTGLSCRFSPARARYGLILTLIVVGAPEANPAAARAVIAGVLRIVAAAPDMGRPLPEDGPPLRWPPDGFGYEVRATKQPWSLRGAAHALRALGFHLLVRLRIPVGSFSPSRHLHEVVANADFQKYDDGLRMTLDCSAAVADAIELCLQSAETTGIVHYGVHRQEAALTTCITPAPSARDHVHFVDGDGGGYARAAQMLKTKIGSRLTDIPEGPSDRGPAEE
ncbi:DUF3095 domain-containing protein [Methylobacterium isbiliense]|uniref:Guanylate cyclase domain-containing protein n=1 Tax=Methylobacterium isbiliense TaxID=315478 RepID=A0ABQ4SKL5_9HYPH|nr:DUF3095 domain-containing protein [Methylobacterium isbiliense]MDN3627643.1 DUF3095 domain-containing protein [Methylobacterium isbiliense]GJE03761.1 hypothetical protein GMJLKIPL_5718 [Methylobacterium isbiliense]